MIKTWIEEFLMSMGVAKEAADEVAVVALMLLIVLGAYVVYWVLRNYLLKVIHKVTEKTSNKWDDALMEARVFHRFLRLIPLTFIMLCVDRMMPGSFIVLKRILFALVIFVGARAVEAFLNAVGDIYRAEPGSQRKPIRPLIQSMIILLYLFASIFITPPTSLK